MNALSEGVFSPAKVQQGECKRATANTPGCHLILRQTHFDLALVWSIDRLARKVIDFLHADESLRPGPSYTTSLDSTQQ